MDKSTFTNIEKHYDRFFKADKEPLVIHEAVTSGKLHIDIMHYEASERFPFQVLATIGASDYKMPLKAGTLSRYNEYMVFLDKDYKFSNDESKWIIDFLMYVAKYACENTSTISCGHSIELFSCSEERYNEHNNMRAAYIMFPMAVPDSSILRLKCNIFKTITFLQAMPITERELSIKINNHPSCLEELFYNEDAPSFLAKSFRD